MTNKQTEEVMGWLRTGGEFVAEQSPMVVQDILTRPWLDFGMFIFWTVLFLFISFLGGGFNSCSDGCDNPGNFVCLIAFMSLICTGVGIIVSFGYCLYAHFTPNLYVLEQLAGMLP